MTPSGIEPATFQLVAQSLNQLRHRELLQILVYNYEGYKPMLSNRRAILRYDSNFSQLISLV